MKERGSTNCLCCAEIAGGWLEKWESRDLHLKTPISKREVSGNCVECESHTARRSERFGNRTGSPSRMPSGYTKALGVGGWERKTRTSCED
jgi:nitrite reductase/ring-hydroxylating ferredoxin subunit